MEASAVVVRVDLHVRAAVVVIRHGDKPWTAAYLAIFDVLLVTSRSRIERNFHLLATVRTANLSGAIGDPIAQRKGLLESGIVLVF